VATATSELIVLAPVAPDLYPVISGEKRYHVHWDDAVPECDCNHFVFRCAFRHDACKHIRAVREHRAAALACPVCRGKGHLIPCGLVSYIRRDGKPDDAGLPCLQCDGSGKR